MTGKHILSIWIVGLLVLGPLVFLIPEGEGLDLRMDRNLGLANASFWGEDTGDEAGWSVACAGDVNRDGYDDLLIGAYLDEDGGVDAGQTYLIFGKAIGWAMDADLSAASASFRGEDTNDYSGYCVAGAGDVNGDGYDDVAIGSPGYDDQQGRLRVPPDPGLDGDRPAGRTGEHYNRGRCRHRPLLPTLHGHWSQAPGF